MDNNDDEWMVKVEITWAGLARWMLFIAGVVGIVYGIRHHEREQLIVGAACAVIALAFLIATGRAKKVN